VLRNPKISAYLYALVAAVAVPLCSLVAYTTYDTMRSDLARVGADALRIAQVVAADTANFHDNAFRVLKRLVQRPGVQAVDPRHCDPVFDSFLQTNPAFANLVLSDLDVAVCSAIPQRSTSIATTNWVRRIRNGERHVVGAPMVGRITGKWVSVLAEPVEVHGRVVGALGLPIDLARYQGLVTNIDLPRGSVMKILDAQGILIAHSQDPEGRIGRPDTSAIAAMVLKQRQGQGRALGVDGVERLHGFAPVADSGWYAVVGVPVESVLEPIRQRALRAGMIAALVAALALALAYRIGYRIRRPILAMARVARAVADGKLDSRVQVQAGPEEVLAVAGQFDTMLDVRHEEERALSKLQRAIEASMNAVAIVRYATPSDTERVEYVNPATQRITGFSPGEMIGRSWHAVFSSDADADAIAKLNAALHERREWRTVLACRRRDGTPFWSEVFVAPVSEEDGSSSCFVVVLSDITQTIEYQRQLEHQATHDLLTGLPNRNLLQDRLQQALALANRHDRKVVTAFLDLDRFKYVNDSLGHAIGDELLKIVGKRLTGAMRTGDTVARLGGDEFVVVLADHENLDAVSAALEKIMATVSQPIRIGAHEFAVTCSIGCSIYPTDSVDAGALLQHADVAMYRAKERGGNSFQFFAADMNAAISERIWMETGLRKAVELQHLVLHYQPRVCLANGRIEGAEALLRWCPPNLEMIPPDRFIPLAEETGLIIPIGAWVLRTACAQAMLWHDIGIPIRVSVNISARQFRDLSFVGLVQEVLEETGLAPAALELELTESLLMEQIEVASERLRDLKAMGVRIAIDDFGTGYSSLSYLKHMPIDRIKIDRSFVQDVTSSRETAEIVRAVIALAHGLNLEVTAEGVESQEQRHFLEINGCDEIQGFHCGYPVPAEELRALLQPSSNVTPLRR